MSRAAGAALFAGSAAVAMLGRGVVVSDVAKVEALRLTTRVGTGTDAGNDARSVMFKHLELDGYRDPSMTTVKAEAQVGNVTFSPYDEFEEKQEDEVKEANDLKRVEGELINEAYAILNPEWDQAYTPFKFGGEWQAKKEIGYLLRQLRNADTEDKNKTKVNLSAYEWYSPSGITDGYNGELRFSWEKGAVTVGDDETSASAFHVGAADLEALTLKMSLRVLAIALRKEMPYEEEECIREALQIEDVANDYPIAFAVIRVAAERIWRWFDGEIGSEADMSDDSLYEPMTTDQLWRINPATNSYVAVARTELPQNPTLSPKQAKAKKSEWRINEVKKLAAQALAAKRERENQEALEREKERQKTLRRDQRKLDKKLRHAAEKAEKLWEAALAALDAWNEDEEWAPVPQFAERPELGSEIKPDYTEAAGAQSPEDEVTHKTPNQKKKERKRAAKSRKQGENEWQQPSEVQLYPGIETLSNVLAWISTSGLSVRS